MTTGAKYVSGVADPVIRLTRDNGTTVITPVVMFEDGTVTDNGNGTTTLTVGEG